MGRKKKVVEEPQEVTINSPSTSFGYSGKINVSLRKGNRTYLKKEYKNHGRWPLFYFLNMCLAGNYTSADAYRPRFIHVFDFNLTGQPVPTIKDDSSSSAEQIATYFKSQNCVSLIAYPFMSAPDITYESNEIGKSIVTYKFTIPFTQIALKESGHIEGFALYADQPRGGDDTQADLLTSIKNPCVYFFLNDGQAQPKVIDLLADVGQAALGDEYNLYIEWTLSVSNQSIVSNNNN